MPQPAQQKYIDAYNFFTQAQTDQRTFTDEEIRHATHFKQSAITRLHKTKWKPYITESSPGNWQCNGLPTREEFYQDHGYLGVLPIREVIKEVPVIQEVHIIKEVFMPWEIVKFVGRQVWKRGEKK